MKRAAVQECRRHQAPPVAVRDTDQKLARDGQPWRRRVQRAGELHAARYQCSPLIDGPAIRADAAALYELGDVDRDVDADEHAGDLCAGTLEAGALEAACHALRTLRLAGMLRAPIPTGAIVIHSVQIGRPHSEQESPVTRSGCR